MEDEQNPEGHTQKAWHHDRIVDKLDRLGFTKDRTAKIEGRLNPKLIALARERSGVETDTQLIELALGNLVMSDSFVQAFLAARGTVDPKIDLEF